MSYSKNTLNINCYNTNKLKIPENNRYAKQTYIFRVQEKLKSMLRRWAEGDFKGDPQLALIPSLFNQLQKEGIDFSNTSSSGEVSISCTIKVN